MQRDDVRRLIRDAARKLLDQLELQLGELVATVSEDKAASRDRGDRCRHSTSRPQKPARRATACASAARARRASRAVRLPPLRLRPRSAQARRGHHRDAGARAGAVEGDPARAREVLLPGVREDHADAGAVASDRARPRRAAAAGRRSCSPSTGRICRSTGRATSTPTKASISTSRRWPTGSARAPRR